MTEADFGIIIAGGRDYADYERVKSEAMYFIRRLNLSVDEIVIISGCCPVGIKTFTRKDGSDVFGADGLGERFAEEKGYRVELCQGDWKKQGRAAGPIRNSHMSKIAKAALIAHDGHSKGTADMIKKAKAANIETEIIYY